MKYNYEWFKRKKYDNLSDCRTLYIHVDRTYCQDLESSETYDTLKQSDNVRNQYMTLPYTAISDQELETDKYYYDNVYNIRKTPYRISYGITHEAITHFLYKSRNRFRWLLYFGT